MANEAERERHFVAELDRWFRGEYEDDDAAKDAVVGLISLAKSRPPSPDWLGGFGHYSHERKALVRSARAYWGGGRAHREWMRGAIHAWGYEAWPPRDFAELSVNDRARLAHRKALDFVLEIMLGQRSSSNLPYVWNRESARVDAALQLHAWPFFDRVAASISLGFVPLLPLPDDEEDAIRRLLAPYADGRRCDMQLEPGQVAVVHFRENPENAT